MKKPPHMNLKTRTLERLLEIYRRSQYRTTASGQRVRWDEPGEDDSDEVRRYNAYLTQRLQQKRDGKKRLKKKGAVPTRNGNPIFEQHGVTEDVHRVLTTFRRAYETNRPMRFREWIRAVTEILDDL